MYADFTIFYLSVESSLIMQKHNRQEKVNDN